MAQVLYDSEELAIAGPDAQGLAGKPLHLLVAEIEEELLGTR